MKHRFKCCVLGQTGLTLQCLEILLQAGHTICGIITPNKAIAEWAISKKIPSSNSLDLLNSIGTYDYLFSIVNDLVLPESILKTPRYLSINFHDSLLPSYAGIHATSWAILNGETQHGVTWHVMAPGIDTGDILKQAIVPIHPQETAFSLNLKCYNKAQTLFIALINELSYHHCPVTPQSLEKRSYYARYQKPPANGLINWRTSAETIDRLIRSLNFGHHPNSFATNKLILFKKVYEVKKLTLTNCVSIHGPGEVVCFTDQGFQVATTTHDIIINQLSSYEGESCSMEKLYHQFITHKNPKNTLTVSKEDMLQKLSEKSRLLAKYEDFWISQISNFHPIHLPFLPLATSRPNNITKKSCIISELNVPKNLIKKIMQTYHNISLEEILFTTLIVYFYRTTQQKELSFYFSHQSLIETVDDLSLFFETSAPYTVKLQDHFNFSDALNSASNQLIQFKKNLTFLKDIFSRYSHQIPATSVSQIGIEFVKEFPKEFRKSHQLVNFLICTKNAKIKIYLNQSIKNNLAISFLEKIPKNLTTLLYDITENPKKSIVDLELISSFEKNMQLIAWNRTDLKFSDRKTVHQLFEEQVEKTPDNIAVFFENHSITYKELNIRSNQLAHFLILKKIPSESKIILCVNRNINMVVSLLGILKSGSAYIPIEKNIPKIRLKKIVQISNPTAVITNSKILNKFFNEIESKKKYHIINIDKFSRIFKEKNSRNPNISVSANQLAYIIYTSGSTGNPKGVLITHKNVVSCIESIQMKMKINPKNIFLALTSLSFDVSALDYYLPLSLGAKTVILSEKNQKNASHIIKLIQLFSINIIQGTPSIFEILKKFKWKPPENLKIMIAGEALSSTLAKYFTKKCSIFNVYGPTETTIYATLSKVTNPNLITIGKPIANTKVYVLDKNLHPLPIGTTGELHIGGIGLARGYLNQPELTALKFIQNPFLNGPTARLYKTGDLVRWLPDGNLEYLGRADDQIKIRGFRVELGEIEQALLKYPKIEQAVVVLDKISRDYPQLVAFVVTHPTHAKTNTFTTPKLQFFIRKLLPDYMVPAVYVILPSFPLNANGKIDKKSLLNKIDQALPANINYRAPGKYIEKKLVEIWKSVLNVPQIGIEDDFFALGGDSIVAMRLIAAAETKYRLSFSIQDLLQNPNIISLARVVQTSRSFITESIKSTAKKVPLTPIQHWFFEQSWFYPAEWSQACLLKINGTLKTEFLQKSLEILVSRHDTLHLRYEKNEDGQQQYYAETSKNMTFFKEVSTDISTLNLESIQKWSQVIQSHFHLTSGPLVGAIIFSDKITGERPCQILIVIHHLLVDGVSWRILIEDLEKIYCGINTKGKLKPFPSSISFQTWAEKLQNLTQSGLFDSEKQYWLQTLSSTHFTLPMTERVKDKTVPLAKNSKKITLTLNPKDTKNLLSKIHSAYDTRINEILLSALVIVFSDWTQQNKCLFHLESHGRQDELLELNSVNTIGWFTSLFPVALDLTDSTWEYLIPSIQQQLRAVPNNGVGYGALRYLSSDSVFKKSCEELPQPQVSFNYWGKFEERNEGKNIFQWDQLFLSSGSENPATHLIEIDCVLRDSHFNVMFTYNELHFKPETIEHLAKAYQQKLLDLISHCLKRIKNPKTAPFLPNFPLTRLTIEQLKSINGSIEDIYPLTSLQKGLLFEDWYHANTYAYQVQTHWAISGNLDVTILKKACKKLLNRHAALRTQFVWKTLDEPIQMVQRHIKLPWKLYDLRHLSSEIRYARLQELLHKDQQELIDLQGQSLFRISIVLLTNTHHHLIWHFHHIVLDGWSFALLIKELKQHYHAIKTHKNLDLSPPFSFSDYLKWLQGKNWFQEKIFWKDYLKELKSKTDIAFLLHKPVDEKKKSHTPNFSHDIFSLEDSKKIRQFCNNHQITLNNFFQSLWGILLYRYTQQKDIVFGVTVSGRSIKLPDIEERVGLFINTVPLRVKVEENMTVIDFLKNTQTSFNNLMDYSYTPLGHIQNWTDLESDTKSLFDTLFVFENYPNDTTKTAGDDLYFEAPQFWDPTHYILTFAVLPHNSISMKLGHYSDQIKPEWITRLLTHLKQLSLEMINDPDTIIHELPLLSSEENQLFLLSSLEQSTHHFFKTALECIQLQSTINPNHIAVVMENVSLTYLELHKKSNQLAQVLIEKNIKPNTFIAVSIPKSISLIISLLAIWKIGAVYVPLDFRHARERLKTIFTISRIKTIITEKPIFNSTFSEFQLENLIFLDTLQCETYSTSQIKLPDDLIHQMAYILYTSGTTGIPKGVVQEQKTLANLIQWQEKSRISREKHPPKNVNVAQFAQITFDVSLQEISYALGNGHTLYIVPEEVKKSSVMLVKFLEKYHINQLFLPTAFLETLCEAGLFLKCPLESLTDIMVAGEALKISSPVREFFNQRPHIYLTNQYGPTETHVVTTYSLPAYASFDWPSFPPIGTSIDNVRAYILDEHQQLMPYGFPGELCLEGANLARGYISDNAIDNIQPFVTHLFSSGPALRLYRTGDKVKWNEQGELEFLGRFDQQVKIRGYRVEISEIEAQLLKQPGVTQCVVVTKPDHQQSLQLIAYIVSSEPIVNLRDSLKKYLPDYMVPTHFIQLETLPLTDNGKINKKALPDPILELTQTTILKPPRHLYDKKLLEIWSEILGINTLNIESNVFDLGANSLNILRSLLLIEKQFNVHLSVNDILLSPTVMQLSDTIYASQANISLIQTQTIEYKNELIPTPLVPLQPDGNKNPLFLIHPIGGTIFWFIDLARFLGKEKPIYGIQDPAVIHEKYLSSFTTLEEMAHFYIQSIKKIQPQGPYSLAGSSFGATVAFEMSKQLTAKGELVEFLGLLDGWAFYPTELQNEAKFKAIIREQTQKLHEQFKINALENFDRWAQLRWQRSQLLWAYKLTKVETQLTLFKAKELLPGITWSKDPHNDWQNYSTRPIETHLIPGNHETIFAEPNVYNLAERLKNCPMLQTMNSPLLLPSPQ